MAASVRMVKGQETPLRFVHHDDGCVVCCSMGGSPEHPGWYFNLKPSPGVAVTVDRNAFPVLARELEGP